MASNASRGADGKAQTKRWLQRQGFEVWDMEIIRVVYTPNGMVPIKRDQVGADLAYINDLQVVFVQVKKGGSKSTAQLTRDAVAAFAEFRWAKHTKRELYIWRPLARQPEVIACP